MMSSNDTSVVVVYNLPDLKCPADDAVALELFQIVEEVRLIFQWPSRKR
jgi:hypothetical protein